MKVEDYISEIDSNRFGVKVAKISKFDNPIEEYIHEFEKNKIDVVFARVQTNNIKDINKLEEFGFLIKDVQITYRKFLENADFQDHLFNDKVQLRDVTIKDLDSLADIALKSFENYGHYYNDKKLDNSKAGDIYKDWISKSLTDDDVADKIIVAEYENKIAGFLSFKIFENSNIYAAGGLGAVSDNFRKLNIFKDINVAGLLWAKKEKMDWVEHNVLVSNLPVNRVYNSLGFHVKDSFVTLHGWLNP